MGLINKLAEAQNTKILYQLPKLISVQKKIFLGWANGLSGYPNSKTIEDPKDAIKKIPNCVLYVSKVSTPIVKVENNPARIDFATSIFFIFL